MIIHKGNQSASMGYHNGIPIWDGVKPEPPDVYYMLSDNTQSYDIILPDMLNTNDIYTEADVIVGSSVGDMFGVLDQTPSFSDNNDLRTFFAFGTLYFDAGGGRTTTNASSVGYQSAKKYNIYVGKSGSTGTCRWTDIEAGMTIWAPSINNGNNVKGYFTIRSRVGLKIYTLKIGNSNGLIVDAVATVNGLLDKISGNIITTSHFTPVKE